MALFSKRHYVFAANWLSGIQSEQYRYDLAIELAEMFSSDNTKFDEEKFFTNCNLGEYIEIRLSHA